MLAIQFLISRAAKTGSFLGNMDSCLSVFLRILCTVYGGCLPLKFSDLNAPFSFFNFALAHSSSSRLLSSRGKSASAESPPCRAVQYWYRGEYRNFELSLESNTFILTPTLDTGRTKNQLRTFQFPQKLSSPQGDAARAGELTHALVPALAPFTRDGRVEFPMPGLILTGTGTGGT